MESAQEVLLLTLGLPLAVVAGYANAVGSTELAGSAMLLNIQLFGSLIPE